RARNPHCASGSRCTQWKHAGCWTLTSFRSGLMSQPLVGAFSPGTEPSLRFGFALYTVEARRMLQVRARFLVRALYECPVRARNPHFVSGPRLLLSARAQMLDPHFVQVRATRCNR